MGFILCWKRTRTHLMQMSGGHLLAAVSGDDPIRGAAEAIESGHRHQYPLMTYQCETIEDVCIASLHFLITHKFHIRKCKNCSRYFVAYDRSDTEYCDRQSPYGADKTCKEDGPGRTYRDAMKVDQVKKIFHQIDSARRMRVSRHPDDEDVRKEYAAWQKAMRHMRDQYKNGAISADRYIAWLEKHKVYTED